MRAVLCVVALLALSAAVDVSARRIHKLKQVLDAANADEADLAVALPFDGDYWQAVKPDVSKALAAEAKKPQWTTADLLNHFFAPENIQLAQQQGSSVQAQVATYTASAMLKQCNEGTCDDKWTDFAMNSAGYYRGGEGNVVLTCTVPADLKTASCALSLNFAGNTLLSCPNAGVAGGKCSNPRPQRFSSGAGVWMSNDVIINTAAPNSALQDVYITKDALTINYKFFGNDANKKLTFTTVFVQSANWAAYKPVLSPAQPAPAPELVKAQKAKVLDTAALLKKFFTAENILLAQQQGSTVVSQIATYSAKAITRSCTNGLCGAYAAYDMTSAGYYRGGEGKVFLTCTVPADLTKAQCDVAALYDGNTLLSCANIGAAGATCTNPRPQRFSSGAGVWMANDFITTTVEAAEQFFTADVFVTHFRFRGLDSNKQLVFSDFTFVANFAGYQFIVSPPQPAPAAELVKAQKAKVLDTAGILKKFFTAENILLAQQQGANAVVDIGAYTATAITRSCNHGSCGAWGAYDMTSAGYYRGGAGSAVLTCTVPADLTKAQCDVTALFAGNTLFSCPNIGAGGKCSNPRPQRFSSGAGVWMANDFITTTVEAAETYFAADQMVTHFRFRGLDSNKMLVFSDFTLVMPLVNFAFVVSPAAPAPAPELVAASKAKSLTTSQLLAKFFTSDNIQLAQMQGSSVPVRSTIGAYTATAVTRSCNTGVCAAYGPYDMTSAGYYRGGEGSIVLTCSVPADLSQAKCDLSFIFAGNTLMSCPDIGAGGKCSNPRPQRFSSGAGVWMSNDFITSAVEAADTYFTNDQLVVHFRFRGLDSNKKLVFSDFTLLSTPLTDFGVPPKTNCLSKTTADAVISAAQAKKGLKSAIVLQSEPVAALIKGAPYKTVEDAVTAIKGIGPRNVVYVSFMWNFSC